MTTDVATIQHLARKCARAGLRLRDAKDLFETLYRADAIMLAKGNVEKAAERSGFQREKFYRARRRAEELRGDAP